MTTKPATAEFTVRRTRIKDSTGAYCSPGEPAQLTKTDAKHYQKLGYVEIDTDTMFNRDDADDEDKAGRTKPDTSAGDDDKEPAGAKTATDAGKSESKDRRRS